MTPLDLRENPPRGVRETILGYYFLPRTIDKVRAKLQGTLGFYKVAPGISGYLFEWLGITEDDFTAAVRDAAGDDEVLTWLVDHVDVGLFPEINKRLRVRAIRDDEHFAQVLPRYPVLRDHPQLRNWFEIFEVDDRWTFDPANAEKVKETAPS